MMPALFSGVSGLKNHQFRLNIIGNNLSNVNTIGYKYDRVTFSDLVYQNVRDGSAPQNGNGGSNPVQMGLGSLVNTVDMINTQGNLESTGRPTDLAIQGDGFFVLGDGSGNSYSRAGNMDIGVDGTLFNSSNGLKFKGWTANNGAVDTSGSLTDVTIPIGQVLTAKATNKMTLAGNLDAGGTLAVGTIASTPALLASGKAASLATDLKNSSGTNLGVKVGDTINISGSVGGTALSGRSLVVGSATTLQDIASAVQSALRSVPDGDLTETATVQPDGSIKVTTDGTSAVTNLQLGISGNLVFNNAFTYQPTILSGGAHASSLATLVSANGSDKLVNMFDASGHSIGLSVGDDVTLLSANTKGTIQSNISVLSDITNTTTYDDYRSGLQSALFTGFPLSGESVAIQSDGSLKVTGADGKSNGITGIRLGAGVNPGDDTLTSFSSAQPFTESQAAADATSYKTSTQVYDTLGNAHTISYTFSKSASNTWNWDASSEGNSVGSGILSFSSAGTLQSATGTLSLPLNNGASTPLSMTPDFSSATQFGSTSSLIVSHQDGYATAELNNFSIGQNGEITGIFSNGVNQLLGQLALASFKNPGGLKREGRNLLSESPNSGLAVIGAPAQNGRGTLVSGTLEMSNVDVAREFTDMIVTQRGFQANARVITTSDQMLEELVNLKR